MTEQNAGAGSPPEIPDNSTGVDRPDVEAIRPRPYRCPSKEQFAILVEEALKEGARFYNDDKRSLEIIWGDSQAKQNLQSYLVQMDMESK